jgi:hypothetical protein
MHRMNSFDRFDEKQYSTSRYMKFKLGNFASNSTQLITDMTTVINNGNSATALANAIAAAGPIMDLPGMLQSVRLNFQEAVEKLAYILNGSQLLGTQTAPSGGPIASGGPAPDSTNWPLLVGIYQILK